MMNSIKIFDSEKKVVKTINFEKIIDTSSGNVWNIDNSGFVGLFETEDPSVFAWTVPGNIEGTTEVYGYASLDDKHNLVIS